MRDFPLAKRSARKASVTTIRDPAMETPSSNFPILPSMYNETAQTTQASQATYVFLEAEGFSLDGGNSDGGKISIW